MKVSFIFYTILKFKPLPSSGNVDRYIKKTTILVIDRYRFPAPIFENFTTFTNNCFEWHCFSKAYYFRQPKGKKTVLQKGFAI